MLETIGVSSLDELIAQTIPDDIRQRAPLDLGPALSETEALAQARQLAARNLVADVADRPRILRHDPAAA